MKVLYALMFALFIGLGANAQCSITFTYTVDGLTVNVVGEGTGANNPVGIINWGDTNNTQTNGLSGSFTYDTAGFYVINLVYYDADNPFGCVANEFIQIDFTQQCNLAFDGTINGMDLTISATGTGAMNTPEYVIDWGDGMQEPGPTATHTYAAAGSYNVCVTYTDPNAQDVCTVMQCNQYIIGNTSCTVELTVTTNGNIVNAVATGTGATSPTYIITWGDNTTPSMASNASHTYTASGQYNVCVIYGDITNPQACNAQTCSTVDITVGQTELSAVPTNLQVSPNPARGEASISVSTGVAGQFELAVFDLCGKKVQEIYSGNKGAGSQRFSWNTQGLSSGVYFIRATNGSETKTIRAIVEE